jgi:hypothetical protein
MITIDIDHLEDFCKLAAGSVVFVDVQTEGHDRLYYFPAGPGEQVVMTCLCREGAWKKQEAPNIKFVEATVEGL